MDRGYLTNSEAYTDQKCTDPKNRSGWSHITLKKKTGYPAFNPN